MSRPVVGFQIIAGRVGSGRVGSSRVGSGRVGSGRVGVGSGGFHLSRVGSDHPEPTQPREVTRTVKIRDNISPCRAASTGFGTHYYMGRVLRQGWRFSDIFVFQAVHGHGLARGSGRVVLKKKLAGVESARGSGGVRNLTGRVGTGPQDV